MAGKKSSNDNINNGTVSDDEVAASDVPPQYLLFLKFQDIKCLKLVYFIVS